jgi:tRNA pseudouridine38-40 synthase
MRNIKLLIAYDGSDFCGWQRQKQDRSVQEVIENALGKMHGRAVSLNGAGRTDSGVHAAGQTANFFTTIDSIPADRFVNALNSILPPDVRILESCETDMNFHARFSALMRTYRYFFLCRRLLPHESRYNLQLYRYPNLKLLNSYCRLLLGEKNCTIFAAAGDTSKSKNRYIYQAGFHIEGERLIFEISANAFLQKMVRSITGTLLGCEEKSVSPQELREIVLSKDRSLSGPTLPPNGLFLWQVIY